MLQDTRTRYDITSISFKIRSKTSTNSDALQSKAKWQHTSIKCPYSGDVQRRILNLSRLHIPILPVVEEIKMGAKACNRHKESIDFMVWCWWKLFTVFGSRELKISLRTIILVVRLCFKVSFIKLLVGVHRICSTCWLDELFCMFL